MGGRRPPGSPVAPAADLRWPTSLVVDQDGTVSVTDAATDTIRRIGPDGTTTVVAAEPGWQPVGLAILADGRLIAAETHWSPAQSTGRLRTCGPS